MSYRSCVWRICTYCTYFSQGSWNNVGVPLFQESLLSEYEDYGHFQLESSYFSLHVHGFISSLIRPTYGAFRVAGRESISNWKYVHISWRKEIMKRVSLFVAYSWQRLYVSYKMGWLSWHSWIILSWAEEYAISSSMAGTSISATDSACLIFAADLEKYDFICCGDKNSPAANRRSPFSFLAHIEYLCFYQWG